MFSAAIVYAYNKGKLHTMTNTVTPLLAVVVSDLIVRDVLLTLTACVDV